MKTIIHAILTSVFIILNANQTFAFEWPKQVFLGIGSGMTTLNGFNSATPMELTVSKGFDSDFHDKIDMRVQASYMKLGTFSPSSAEDMEDFISTEEISLKSFSLSVIGRWQYRAHYPLYFRIGYDVWDDDGILLGIGTGLRYDDFLSPRKWTKGLELTFEFQKRLATKSYLVSLIYEIPDFSNTESSNF